MSDTEQVPEDEPAAEAEQQPRAERADDNQAAKLRDWFQPVFGPAPTPSTASPAKPASGVPASPAKPVPTFTPNPPPSPARPTPSFTPNPAPAPPSPAK